ncbi:MAG: UDP-N-acetylmuramoyl-L-alanine--D-glutamate ligase [Rhodanobacteraceae bacterium]
MRIAELAGCRVAIWGLGREGRAALAALGTRLPTLPVTVFCSANEAAEHAEIDATLITTAPDAAKLAAFDIVIKSPGISAYRPEITAAERDGTRFTSGTALWFAEHPEARVIAVTGTKGKSTVSALIAHLLRARRHRVALAGNIGLPLLELLDPPLAPDWWVIELSSFQTRAAGRVAVGVITNVYEDHLDWHGSRERYLADKLAIAVRAVRLVVNAKQPDILARIEVDAVEAGNASPDICRFGAEHGWHVRKGAIFRGDLRVLEVDDVPLPGAHNALNLCAALAALEAAGDDALAAARHIATFRPLPHRLQMLGPRDGLNWIDDSIATTPRASLEALASVPRREVTTLLVGGHDRGLDWSEFVDAVMRAPPHAIVTMGASGPRIAALLRSRGALPFQLEPCGSLADAVSMARTQTNHGGTVLLSPGAPSFDAFRDYVERGRTFATLAGFDADTIGEIRGLGIA